MLLKNTILVAKFGQFPVFSKISLIFDGSHILPVKLACREIYFVRNLLTCTFNISKNLRRQISQKKVSIKFVQNHTVGALYEAKIAQYVLL